MEKSREIRESYALANITEFKGSAKDNKLTEAKVDTSKSLLVVIDAIKAGTTLNNHNFMPATLRAAAQSYYTPYHKPLIKNHDIYSEEPLGRIFDAAFIPESQVVRVWAYVSDEDTIQKIKDGRYSTVSIGARVSDARCSICGNDYFDYEGCSHWAGREYNGKVAAVDIFECEFYELSFVNAPACEAAGVVDFGNDVQRGDGTTAPSHEADPAMAAAEAANDERPIVTASVEAPESGVKVTELSDKHKELHEKFASATDEEKAALEAEHAEIVKLMKENHMHHSTQDALDETAPEVAETQTQETETTTESETSEETVTETTEGTTEETVEETAVSETTEPVTFTCGACQHVVSHAEAKFCEMCGNDLVQAPETQETTEETAVATTEATEETAETQTTEISESASENPATLETEKATIASEHAITLAAKDQEIVELSGKVESLGSEIAKLKAEIDSLQQANVDQAVVLHNTLTDRIVELKEFLGLIVSEEVEATRQGLQYRSVEALSAIADELASQPKFIAMQGLASGVSTTEESLVPTLVTEGQEAGAREEKREKTFEEKLRSALKPQKR